MRILKEGDRGEALCPECRTRVETRYTYRSLHLEETDVDVDHVLVGVCEICGEIVAIPAQSTPRLKEARDEKSVVLNARIPYHLDDTLRLLAHHFDTPCWSFCSCLVRFYLHELARDDAFARRVRRLGESGLAGGKATTKLSVRTSAELAATAWSRARDAGIGTRTEMLKGLILAAYEDVLRDRAPRRAEILRGIAAAA